EKRVLRRCPHCRLLFEAAEGTNACVVCGVTLEGLALPIDADSVPTEFVDVEPTARLDLPR
ncbi:MAG TPA: hypothetical protein VF945_10720, partial [Polyangia bacterium]